MAKVVDTSGPEWSTDLPDVVDQLYWMHEPEKDWIGIIKPISEKTFICAFSGILFREEIRKGTRFARIPDPPGCHK